MTQEQKMDRRGRTEMKRKLPEYVPDNVVREEVERILNSLKAIGLYVVRIDRKPYSIGCLDVFLGIVLFVIVVVSSWMS